MATTDKAFCFYIKGGRPGIEGLEDDLIRTIALDAAERLAEKEQRPLIGVQNVDYSKSLNDGEPSLIAGTAIATLKERG